MYLKFVLKETLSVLKSFVLSIFYLAVEKGEVSEKMWQSVTMGVGGGGKIADFLRYVLFEWPLSISVNKEWAVDTLLARSRVATWARRPNVWLAI